MVDSIIKEYLSSEDYDTAFIGFELLKTYDEITFREKRTLLIDLGYEFIDGSWYSNGWYKWIKYDSHIPTVIKDVKRRMHIGLLIEDQEGLEYG